MMPISVLIADDHSIIRYGLCSIINQTEGFEVIGEASNGAETIELFKQFYPNITILDITMPDRSGIEICKEIRQINPDALVIVMTMHLNEEYLRDVLTAGASGYMLKNSTKDELIINLNKVIKGEKAFSSDVSELMTQSYAKGNLGINSPKPSANTLTKRELEILALIVQGKRNQDIADDLFISPRTVESHRANMMNKLNIRNTATLVKLALENKWV